MNAQSIRNKITDFIDYVCDHKYDRVAITKTWLQQHDDATRLELCPPGYKFIDFQRQGRSGGGIGLLYKDFLKVTKVRNGAEESFEFCEVLIQSSTSRKIRLVIVYRPHISPSHHRVPMNTFLREFSNYMEPIILTKEPLIIVGDFNIHVDTPTNTDAVKFLDLLDSFVLYQHVTVYQLTFMVTSSTLFYHAKWRR